MALFLFRGRDRDRDPQAGDAARRLGDLTRAILALPEEASVSVTEIACSDPECGGGETVVLVMLPKRRTQAAKVRKAIGLVTEEELRAALATIEV